MQSPARANDQALVKKIIQNRSQKTQNHASSYRVLDQKYQKSQVIRVSKTNNVL